MNNELKIARTIAKIMDGRYEIFGFKFGLDPIIGLVPVVGDILPFLVGLYLLWLGRKMGVPENKYRKMWLNLLIDTTVGTIPAVGDVGDFLFRSFEKNFKILEEHEKGGVIVEGESVG